MGRADAWDGPPTGRLERLHDDPEEGLERLAEEIRNYWEAAIAPYWPRIRTLLEGDVLYRARLLAELDLPASPTRGARKNSVMSPSAPRSAECPYGGERPRRPCRRSGGTKLEAV
ncbi:hypothetical protein FHR32_006834 [Streptosporangium album]|uniref:Uncharacterized protein n=1 Tax=Streptosporangium album TaxID=47479 RepID=A0A7W7WD47_9ACTN|nr:hypothetical protein [Streptosporangium album]MBB4942448.1 hypothetical protein [Streptosporangium album]